MLNAFQNVVNTMDSSKHSSDAIPIASSCSVLLKVVERKDECCPKQENATSRNGNGEITGRCVGIAAITAVNGLSSCPIAIIYSRRSHCTEVSDGVVVMLLKGDGRVASRLVVLSIVIDAVVEADRISTGRVWRWKVERTRCSFSINC